MPATGSRTLAQTAGGKRKGLVWDLVKDVESVIKKDGTKTSEKKWVCRFCEKPFQGGPNVIQAHHGVHGTGKKKAIQLCKHTPADVKARLQQEMSITLRSIAEKETSEVIQIVRQQEDHVARMENAGVELSMLVESGQLKLAFPRVPASPTVASAAPTSATSSGSSSTATTRNEPNLAADSEQAAKQSAAPKPQSVPKVTMVSAMSKLHSKALRTSSTRTYPLAGLQLASLQLHLRTRYSRRRSSWSLGRHAPHMCTPQSLAARTHTAAVRRTHLRSWYA